MTNHTDNDLAHYELQTKCVHKALIAPQLSSLHYNRHVHLTNILTSPLLPFQDGICFVLRHELHSDLNGMALSNTTNNRLSALTFPDFFVTESHYSAHGVFSDPHSLVIDSVGLGRKKNDRGKLKPFIDF